LHDLKARLIVLCQDDPSLLQAVRDPDFLATLEGVTSQVMDAMAQALGSYGARMLDGTPISLHGDLAAGFAFAFDPKLGLVVQCNVQLSIPYGQTGDPDKAALVRLSGDANMRCSFAMGADGIARMVDLPAFTNKLQVSASWADQPEPRNAKDVFHPGSPEEFRQDYKRYLQSPQVMAAEPYEFIEAVDDLPEDDAEALRAVLGTDGTGRTDGIAATFIHPGAEKFVNVADELIQKVLAAINSPDPDIRTIRSRLRELRAGAVDLSKDTFNRWVLTPGYKTVVEDLKTRPKQESPKNAKPKGKTPSTEMERSGFSDFAVPAEVAKRQAELARKRPEDINSSLLRLANFELPPHRVQANAEVLLPQKGDPFADAKAFQAHVSAFLIASRQQPFDLAVLRYKLERVVSPDLRDSPRIQAALAAIKQAQSSVLDAGPAFDLMSPEAILLQYAPPGLNSRYLAGWFKDDRVGEKAISEFFRSIRDPAKLRAKTAAISDLSDVRQDVRDKLVAIGQQELATRVMQAAPRVAPRPPQRAVQEKDWYTKSGDALRQGLNLWLLDKRLRGSHLTPDDLQVLGALAPKLDTEDLDEVRSNDLREMVRTLASKKQTEWEPLQEAWLSELLDIFAPAPPPPEESSPASVGAEFIRRVQSWNFETSLLPEDTQALEKLAGLFDELKPQRTHQGGLVFATDAPAGTLEAYLLLQGSLEAQLDKFGGQGWQPEQSAQLESVRKSLETLRLDTRAVQLVLRAFTAPAT
jgi:hypothetical protein